MSCLAPHCTQMPIFQKNPNLGFDCNAMVVLSLYKKTQIGYTQYVDNDDGSDNGGLLGKRQNQDLPRDSQKQKRMRMQKRNIMEMEDDEDDDLEFEDLDFEWDVVQQMPSFPGGEKNLFKFLKNNTNYPELSRQRGTQGKVIASFVVEKDGSISDIKILKGVDQYIDQESIKVIKAMPKWKPGKQMGKKVRVRQILPLKFTLMY